MGPDLEMTDSLAERVLSGTVEGTLDTPFAWQPKHLPAKKNAPVHMEASAPIRIDLACKIALRLRIGLDNPWTYSIALLHLPSGVVLRRLDIRGTHRDRETGEEFLFRTHEHKWSQARGNKEVCAQGDIRCDPAPVADATLTSMDAEYDRVVRDFIAQCRMTVGEGYVWVRPQPPLEQQTFDGLEDYP